AELVAKLDRLGQGLLDAQVIALARAHFEGPELLAPRRAWADDLRRAVIDEGIVLARGPVRGEHQRARLAEAPRLAARHWLGVEIAARQQGQHERGAAEQKQDRGGTHGFAATPR